MAPTLRPRANREPAEPTGKRAKKIASGFRVKYAIRDSAIAGRGVFALEPIARGTLVWEYAIGQSVREHDEASLRARMRGLSSAARTDLLEHVYVWEGSVIEILDDAKVWNHASDPNTGEHPDAASGAGDGMSSYALRHIAAGEELTDDYALHDSLPWFEALCSEHRATSCTQLGRAHR